MLESKPADWSITLTPHRSLTSLGLRVVLAAVVFSNFVVAVVFFTLKAWPVFAFLGLDVALIFWAFAANNKAAKRSEKIQVVGEEVVLTRENLSGSTETKFNRRWVRVLLEYDEARELIGRLFFVTSGKRTEIASFLGADERKALALELKDAIIRPKI
jgi:uncharacterized membrane protein